MLRSCTSPTAARHKTPPSQANLSLQLPRRSPSPPPTISVCHGRHAKEPNIIGTSLTRIWLPVPRRYATSELATRVPLIIRAPWKPASVGRRTGLLFELIDLVPTMAALAGAPPPREGTMGLPPFDGVNVETVRVSDARSPEDGHTLMRQQLARSLFTLHVICLLNLFVPHCTALPQSPVRYLVRSLADL